MITIDLLGNRSNELNESFSVVISWSSLSTDHNNSWNEFVLSLMLRSVKDIEISMNYVKNVHKLSLVLMNSLNLDVIQGIDRDIISSLFFNPRSKLGFVLLLNLDELFLELLVIGIWKQVSQVIKSSNPFINTTESITNEFGKSWVAAVDPSSWSNTVCLILKLTWVKCIEFTENGILKELRMESSDTVNGVGANNGKIGHSNLLWVSFLDE